MGEAGGGGGAWRGAVRAPGEGELALAVEVKPGGLPNRHYAEKYQVTERQVTRWRKRGREVKEAPPLDDPRRFLEWCERWMSYRPNKKLVAAVEAAAAEDPPAPAAEEEEREVPVDPVDLEGVDGVVDLGLPTMRKIVTVKGKALARAYADGTVGERKQAEKEFNDACDSLRKLEATQLQLAKAGGDLVAWEEVEALISNQATRLGDEVLAGMVKLVRQVASDLEGPVQRKLAEQARDEVFRRFKGAVTEEAAA